MGIHGSIHNLSLDIEFSSIEDPQRIKWWELQNGKFLETLLPPKLKILQGRNAVWCAQAWLICKMMFIGHLICLTYCMKFVASSQAFMHIRWSLGRCFQFVPKKKFKKFGKMTFLKRYGWLHQEVNLKLCSLFTALGRIGVPHILELLDFKSLYKCTMFCCSKVDGS